MYDLSESKLELKVSGHRGEPFQVIQYHGTEGLSLLFRFEIDFSAGMDNPCLDHLVGRPATFVIKSPGGARRFHGIIGRIQQLGEHGGESCCRAGLVPTLWLLTHRYQCRVFQGKTVPEIIEDVIRRAGLFDGHFRIESCLIDKHPRREYCVQYRETDFNFISRLMEEEGIFYFFEHDERETRLVVADSVFFRPLDPADRSLPFRPPSGMNAPDEHVFQFLQKQEIRPTGVVLRDYNYINPSLDLQCTGGSNTLEVSDYPGEYQWQAHGNLLAQIRAQELQCRGKTAVGRSNSHRLAAGICFALRGHPTRECNGEYVVTRVTYRGRQSIVHTFDEESGAAGVLGANILHALDEASRHPDPAVRGLVGSIQKLAAGFRRRSPAHPRSLALWLLHGGQVTTDPAAIAAAHGGDPLDWLGTLTQLVGGNGQDPLEPEASIFECEFECIPSDVTFRPPRVTPKPLMRGSQTAVVVGPKGEEIYTDKLGRVKVQFYWDREGKRDEHSSCWIRVSQPWAGAGYGGLAIPRIGQEVIVDFLEGDPDRPIITGRVYNAEQTAPQSMPAPSRMTGRGPEPIAAMQNRPQTLPAACTRTTIRSNSTPGGGGANEITLDDAAGSELIYINASKDFVFVIADNSTTTVDNDMKLSVGNCLSEFIAISHDVFIGINETQFIGCNRTEVVGCNETITVGMNRTEAVGMNETLTVGLNRAEVIGLNHTEAIGVDMSVKVGNDIKIVAGSSITIETGLSQIYMNKDGTIKITGKVITVEASTSLTEESPLTTIVGATNMAVIGTATQVQGHNVHVLAGDLLHMESKNKLDSVAAGQNVIQGKPIKLN